MHYTNQSLVNVGQFNLCVTVMNKYICATFDVRDGVST